MSMIVRVNVVLNRLLLTVTDVSTTCTVLTSLASHSSVLDLHLGLKMPT